MKVGGYRVVSMISKGGFGDVALGRSDDGREVAIKLMRDRPDAPEVLERIQREQRLQTLFRASQGFVPIIDAGESAYGPYLVMPYLSGGSLRSKLEQGPLGLQQTLSLSAALSRAMATAHRLGVVHRDLKPDNILFDDQGRPFICDLGLAKHFRRDLPGGSQSVPLSKTGELRGTFGYMAPEQIRDAKSVGPPADVFSLGVIVHECLGADLPYSAASPMRYLEEVERGRPKPLSEAADCPAWLSAIVQRCLQPQPERRFPDAQALALALEAQSSGATGRRTYVALAVIGAALLALAAGAFAFRAPPPEPAGPSPAEEAQERALSSAREELKERRPRPALARLSALEAGPEVDALRLEAYRALVLEAMDRAPRRAIQVLEEASAVLPSASVDALTCAAGRHALHREDASQALDLLDARRPGALRGREFASFYLERARTALARGRSREALLTAARSAQADPSRSAWIPKLDSIYRTEFSMALGNGDTELWFETVLAGLRLGLNYGLFNQGASKLFGRGLLAALEERAAASPDDPELSLYLALALRRDDLAPGGKITPEASRRAIGLAERLLAGDRLTVRARPLAYESLAENHEFLGDLEQAEAAYLDALEAHHPRPDDCALRMSSMARTAKRSAAALEHGREYVRLLDDRVAKTLEGGEALARDRPPGHPLHSYPLRDEVEVRQRARHVLLDLLLRFEKTSEAEALIDEIAALRPTSIWADGARAKREALGSGDLSFFDVARHPAAARDDVRALAKGLLRVVNGLNRTQLKERLKPLVETN